MSRGLLIAAPRSGSGKTVAMLAIAAALRRRGVRLRAAKSGPDYIDPGFHAACLDSPCLNLDSWAMPAALLDSLAAGPADELLLVEASMGLFDGVSAPRGAGGRAADLAARFGLPVLLVLDVSGQSQSAAAVARGFALFEPDVRVAGVLLNRAGSARHRDGARQAIEQAGLRVFGCLMRDGELALPERHLGLVQAREHGMLDGFLLRLAERAERDLDLDAILAVASELPAPAAPGAALAKARAAPALPPPGQRIALAQDDAFSFIYPHVLQGWRAAGAEIVPFSPLAGAAPPEDCDCCWLPGGYPELHAGRLAAAHGFLGGLRRFAQARPVHGECGGYMVLGRAILDAAGTAHPMAGLLSHVTSFRHRRMVLGYREARLAAASVLGAAGGRLRGHEFHYASLAAPGDDPPLATLRDAAGAELGAAGGRRGGVSGGFFHAIAACGATLGGP